MNTGTLVIVATPIGNMQDMSLHAIKSLLTADVIACEDTRRAGLLLQKVREDFVIPSVIEESSSTSSNETDPSTSLRMTKKPRLISYYDQVEKQKTPEIINFLLQGLTVTLISDAGTPLVSDPGYRIVKEVIAAGLPIESVPGPSAVITALTVSGLPSDKFFFIGYLPKKEGHRKELLHSLKNLTGQLKTTIIFFEAPHRIVGTLEELQEVLGAEKHIVIARELTKTYEEVLRGSVTDHIAHFKKTTPKGEFVLLFNTED